MSLAWEDVLSPTLGHVFMAALAIVTVWACMRPWRWVKLGAWLLLGFGLVGMMAVVSEGGIRLVLLGILWGVLWGRAAEASAERQGLRPLWFWPVAALLSGGVLLVIPMWHRGSEWRTRTARGLGWLLFWGVLVALWAVCVRILLEEL